MARKKYACARCKEGVVTAPWRGKVIEKGLLGPGFLSHVIVERFGNPLPYDRLEGKYRSEGLELSRSVLCESMARCAELLEPIAEQTRKEILASPVVNTDDTAVAAAASAGGGGGGVRVPGAAGVHQGRGHRSGAVSGSDRANSEAVPDRRSGGGSLRRSACAVASGESRAAA